MAQIVMHVSDKTLLYIELGGILAFALLALWEALIGWWRDGD